MTGGIAKKVSEFDKEINKVDLIKLVEADKEQSPVSVMLACFNVLKVTHHRWIAEQNQLQRTNGLVGKIEKQCMENNFSYDRVITT